MDLRYRDLVIEVDVRVVSGRLSDLGPLAERVPAIAAALAKDVQDILDGDVQDILDCDVQDILDGLDAGDRSTGSG